MLDLSPSCEFGRQKEKFQRKKDPNRRPVIHQEEAGQLISGWSLVLTLDDGRRMCSRRSRPGPPAQEGGQSDGTWSGIGRGSRTFEMLPNTACAVPVDEPCPGLGLGLLRAVNDQRPSTWRRRMGTAKQQGGSRH